MRLRSVTFRGLTRFTQPATLDLSEAGNLVALVGRNGEGKTTALEAPVGALYGVFPSRPGRWYTWARPCPIQRCSDLSRP